MKANQTTFQKINPYKPQKKTIICLDCDGSGINEKGNKCTVCKGVGNINVTITKKR